MVLAGIDHPGIIPALYIVLEDTPDLPDRVSAIMGWCR
ncbi:hypothetical protein ASZ90_015555 [hydrocarbon metagenome]|uniref:Uncharacterized protein n=1 Tax=hydrocarbon metagenome TaxID=938273 RepID=A0A0W8F1M2_9ZZZZ